MLCCYKNILQDVRVIWLWYLLTQHELICLIWLADRVFYPPSPLLPKIVYSFKEDKLSWLRRNIFCPRVHKVILEPPKKFSQTPFKLIHNIIHDINLSILLDTVNTDFVWNNRPVNAFTRAGHLAQGAFHSWQPFVAVLGTENYQVNVGLSSGVFSIPKITTVNTDMLPKSHSAEAVHIVS